SRSTTSTTRRRTGAWKRNEDSGPMAIRSGPIAARASAIAASIDAPLKPRAPSATSWNAPPTRKALRREASAGRNARHLEQYGRDCRVIQISAPFRNQRVHQLRQNRGARYGDAVG